MPSLRPPSSRWAARAATFLLTLLLAVPVAAQPLQRARDAQAKGDLRAAQIEFRNAVRAEPNNAAARVGLANVSLDLGDGTTAEREARAALERGWDAPAATALLVRAYLAQNRAADLLRDLPIDPAAPAPLRAQVAAGRALAQLTLDRAEDAKASVEEALRLDANAVEPQLAAAALALTAGDRAAAEAAVDRALAINPNAPEGLLRKGGLQLGRGERREAVESFGRVLTANPGNVPARLRRAEALIELGEDARARADVDAVLTTLPNSTPGVYLRAVLLSRAGDWRGTDEALQRIGPALGNFPDGFLLSAVAKRAIGQTAQAEDAARRQVARRPEDARAAKLLAVMELEANRPDGAAAPLTRLVSAGRADAEAWDLLGRAHVGAGRPREAAEAFAQAATLAPQDAAIRSRLAAARLVLGDAVAAAEAARETLRLSPNLAGMRELLATALLARGDLAGAAEEMAKLSPDARRGEAGGVLEASLRAASFDVAGARAGFEAVLRDHPNSTAARLGLARLLGVTEPAAAERLLAEVLQREPGNADAAARLSAAAQSGGPRAAPARAALEAAQAAAPGEPGLALRLADLLVRVGEPARAVTVLDAEPLRARTGIAELAVARAEARAAADRLPEALDASRSALAEFPNSVAARRQLAGLLARSGDPRAAEAVIQEGLRTRPGDPGLQTSLIALVQQARGIDAALGAADRLAAQQAAQPAASTLRGDLLMSAQRREEAVRAYAAAHEARPSAALAQRQALVLRELNRPEEASAVLRAWLQREPTDVDAAVQLASFDIEAGRLSAAEIRLSAVLDRLPDNPVVLNNLAWLLGQKGGAEAPRARAMAERAYFLSPSADTADTLGWLLAQGGDAQLAVPLLRLSVAARSAARQPDPAGVYRLAFALRAAGEREEALRVLEPALAGGAFPERPQAERLLAELRAGR